MQLVRLFQQRAELGPFRTVWGIKQRDQRPELGLSWELYFYAREHQHPELGITWLRDLVAPQLVVDADPPIRLWDTMKNRAVGSEEVRKKFGVGPTQLGDLLALAGDSVDDVPGVPGIGPKTATTLLESYGELEVLLERAGEIKQKKRRERLIEFADQARLSRKLVELRRDAPRDRELNRAASAR